jgi:predicted transposase YdaD
MDSYLKLTAAEMVVYNREVEAFQPKEREAVMQLTNEWIEIGKVEGRTEGRTEGRVEGRLEGRVEARRDLILRQLRRRIGQVSPEVENQIAHLPDGRLDDLAEALLDFQQPMDADRWLATQA